ncbi:MAG: hypothetical protein LZ173_01265 [Thaumarchaeota archaeon]|nr:hypothetical protein [Candidatus Geocrenenecus arthurdayi]
MSLVILLVMATLFIILFIIGLQVSFEMFKQCWYNIHKCWFIPEYPLPQS